jgi:hypothetical protein
MDIATILGEDYQLVSDTFPDSDKRNDLITRGRHCKYLGLDYLITHYAELCTGFCRANLKERWRFQCLLDRKKIKKDFLATHAASFETLLPAVAPQVEALRGLNTNFTRPYKILKRADTLQ